MQYATASSRVLNVFRALQSCSPSSPLRFARDLHLKRPPPAVAELFRGLTNPVVSIVHFGRRAEPARYGACLVRELRRRSYHPERLFREFPKHYAALIGARVTIYRVAS